MSNFIKNILSKIFKAKEPSKVEEPAMDTPKEEVNNKVQMQCFVTKRMIMDMNALGWKKSQYGNFTPQQIADIIKHQKGPN
jgi:hypothetical protein